MSKLQDFFKKAIGWPTQAEIEDFIDAAGENDRERVGKYLSRFGKRHINHISEKLSLWGMNALMNALDRDRIDMAAFLIGKGANVNAPGQYDKTALIVAWDAAAVSLLIGKGADVNAADDIGRTALISATFNHNIPKMKILLENGADPDASLYWNPKNNLDSVGCKGYTPLMIAASYGHPDSMELLMHFNAKITRNGKGQTALDITRQLKESVYEVNYGNMWHNQMKREPCRTTNHDACLKLMEKYNIQKSAEAPHKGIDAPTDALPRIRLGKKPL